MSIWKSDVDPVTKTQEIFVENGDTLPARFNVDSRDIKEGAKIGEGNWTVHKAEWLGRNVAVKKFNCNNTFHSVSLTSKEVNRMLSLRHPNILKLLGFYLLALKDSVLQCSMIMERMDCDLDKYIEERQGIQSKDGGGSSLSDDQVLYIMAEIARGMKHIHERGCCHRDLKPGNILMRKSVVTGFNVDVKIADFGSSELMRDGHCNPTAGTTRYKAPEQFDPAAVLLQDKMDVFSFGALCSKIMMGKDPYEDYVTVKAVKEHLRNGGKPKIPNRNLPEDVIGVITECLDTNPQARPDFQKISSILDRVLGEIREKMPRPLATSASTSLHLKEHSSDMVCAHDDLVKIVHNLGLPKRYREYFIPFEELIVGGLLSEGVEGRVYEVKWKGILYALKLWRNVATSPNYDFFKAENSIMEEYFFEVLPKLSHENIVTFMGYSVTPDGDISTIMELLAEDLHTVLDSHQFGARKLALDEQKRLMIMKGIAEGMKYLHGQGVVHGNLSARNVMVYALNSGEMVVKLIDFGCKPRNCPTQYAAPEILRDVQLNMLEFDLKELTDVYSFGILCHKLLGGALPKDYMQAIIKGRRPSIPMRASPKLKYLLERCWHQDPLERPTFSQICEDLSIIRQELL